MTQSRGRGKRSAQDAANTRRNILNVAASCFAQAGFDRASVRDIAAEAGVSHGVLRHHFGSKADLWQAVMSEVFSEFQAKVAPLLADDSTNDAAERFRRLVRGFIEVTQSHTDYARLFVMETQGDNERAEFCRAQFRLQHQAIGPLFAAAKEVLPELQHHTNDSFSYCLLSLTYFPLMFPALKADQKDIDVDFLMQVLFSRPAMTAG